MGITRPLVVCAIIIEGKITVDLSFLKSDDLNRSNHVVIDLYLSLCFSEYRPSDESKLISILT